MPPIRCPHSDRTPTIFKTLCVPQRRSIKYTLNPSKNWINTYLLIGICANYRHTPRICHIYWQVILNFFFLRKTSWKMLLKSCYIAIRRLGLQGRPNSSCSFAASILGPGSVHRHPTPSVLPLHGWDSLDWFAHKSDALLDTVVCERLMAGVMYPLPSPPAAAAPS